MACVIGLGFGTDTVRAVIAERFREQGLTIEGASAIGGVARKSPCVMRTLLARARRHDGRWQASSAQGRFVEGTFTEREARS